MYNYCELDDEQNQEYCNDLYEDGKELDFTHADADNIGDVCNDVEIAEEQVTVENRDLLQSLRSELKKWLEDSRRKFKVTYNDQTYSCVPITETKSGKFVFEIEGKLVGVKLPNIAY
jgi:uncharacterized FlaG/YvyC family protein